MHWRGEISFYGGVSFIGSRFTERLFIFFSLGEKSSQSREMEASLNRLWRNEVKGLFCSEDLIRPARAGHLLLKLLCGHIF
jgi:hypothetical protein